MEYVIETVNETNMGDHDERLRTVHAVVPGETVEQMVKRVFPDLENGNKPGFWRQHNFTDEIVIRAVKQPDPVVPVVGAGGVDDDSEGPPF